MQILKHSSINASMTNSVGKRSIALVILAAVLLVISVPAFGANLISADRDPLQLIESEFAAGRISRDEKALLQIQAIHQPDQLPARFRTVTSASDRIVSRFATMAIVDIKLNWDKLSRTTQQSFTEAFSRHTTAFTIQSPGGFFKLHYDTTGTHAVPKTDSDLNGIPDFVEKCAAYCDSSLDYQLAMGFVPPLPDGVAGGDSTFDVYFENTGLYGYAVPETAGPQPWNDYSAYLVLNHNFVGFPPNDDPEGDVAGAAKVTVAHELHHCVQFAYDIGEGNWFMELDATCMEDLVFDQVNDNYSYLPSYLNYPDTSLMTGTMQLHWYGSFIWDMFLVEKFDTTLLRAVWNGARFTSVYQAMSDSLQSATGWSQDSAFVEFTKWCFATGPRNDNNHFAEAGSYPMVNLANFYTSYPVPTTTSVVKPAGYGAAYVQFQPESQPAILRINFDGADTRQWAAYVIKSTTFNTHEFIPINLNPVTYAGSVDVPNVESCYAVTLVGVNLSEFSTAGNFTYSAQMRSPYDITSKVVTDPGIYSGAVRLFQYQVKNPAPTGDVYKIVASDNHAWLGVFTQDLFVAAHDSQSVSIPVSVPDGTPLGATSDLVFSAISKSDSTIVDTARVTAITVLQRGDVSFDGIIDVADITRLIDYFFISQGPLSPELEAGNVDCTGSVDVSDLTWLIMYLFNAGAPCPCNPY